MSKYLDYNTDHPHIQQLIGERELNYKQPKLQCETKALYTGEHCPEKPTRIIYDEDGYFFLCEKCYENILKKRS